MKVKEFFCEECGKPVSLRASKCPHCGRVFDAVKCPKCSFTGRADLFSNGCPTCGYLRAERGAERRADDEKAFASIEPGLVTPETDGAPIAGVSRKVDKRGKTRRQIPSWIYTVISVGLLGLLIILLVVYIRL